MGSIYEGHEKIGGFVRMNNSKIAICIGTRAEYIKTFYLMLELQKQKIDYHFISTGQHNLNNLCETFGTKRPDVILSPEPDKSSKFNAQKSKALKWVFGMIFKIRKELKKLPDLKYILFHGDTMSTFASALGSSRLLNPFKKYKNVHLEAGLRSFSCREPFPEEIIRRIVTFFSDILICPSKQAELNLKKYKNKEIYHLGNTILDSVDYSSQIAQKRDLKPFGKRFALVVIHRHENIQNKERLSKIVEIINSIKIPVYFSLHDNTKNQLIKFGLYEKLNKNIHFKKNMDYVSFLYQMRHCYILCIDGGSIQEESLVYQKPCVILRKNTERPEGLSSNFQYLSKLNVEETKEKIKEYLSKDFKVKEFKNPYGEVGVSKKIVDILK